MHYKLSTKNENQHFLNIEFTVKVTLSQKELEIQLPAWRPGRYELGNFAKNIQKFKVFGESGNVLPFNKITKDRWLVQCNKETKITVKYNYYAIDFNAGSTYIDKDVLYVNPVNCFLYVENKINEPCTVEVPIKKNQQVACGVRPKKGMLKAKSFHQLVDSPFIISSKLQKKSYEVKGTKFYIWFYGECKPEWTKILKDFKKFTTKQMQVFGSIPVKEYHFINIIHPFKAYHGVEHVNSTIITLGPSYELMNELYTEFLGVSSHELYHTWNIKSIRPKEMLPYEYSKENYSKLGYVCEGVTTFMGDFILYESGVFNKEQYIKEFNQYIKRHFSNDGRLNLSVANSSFDTWLDGYVMGVPNRKSSIYVEGALVSFMLDVHIKKATQSKKSLHTVMKIMYKEFGLKNKGYTEQDYKQIIEQVSGKNFDRFFKNYIWGTKSFEPELKKCLTYLGYKLVKQKSKLPTEQYGLKLSTLAGDTKVIHVKEGSPAYLAGLSREDIITTINNYPIHKDLDKWLGYFKTEEIVLGILRNGKLNMIKLEKINKKMFYNYFIK